MPKRLPTFFADKHQGKSEALAEKYYYRLEMQKWRCSKLVQLTSRTLDPHCGPFASVHFFRCPVDPYPLYRGVAHPPKYRRGPAVSVWPYRPSWKRREQQLMYSFGPTACIGWGEGKLPWWLRGSDLELWGPRPHVADCFMTSGSRLFSFGIIIWCL